jgi:predicted AAA+ superfamily ATPase
MKTSLNRFLMLTALSTFKYLFEIRTVKQRYIYQETKPIRRQKKSMNLQEQQKAFETLSIENWSTMVITKLVARIDTRKLVV